MNLNRSTIKIAGATLLAPVAVILQIFVPLFVTPWGMQIDLVAIPWIICWIIFGLKPALLSLCISAPLVGFLGPFAGGWVGATMKSVATIWMFLIPTIFAWKIGGTKRLLENKRLFVIAAVIALAVRALVTVIFNFYFAIPFFFDMTPAEIVGFFSSVTTLGFVGIGAYITEVAVWNVIQGIMDLSVSTILGLIIFRRIPALTSEQ
jgi:riboflavin transporter FmnP